MNSSTSTAKDSTLTSTSTPTSLSSLPSGTITHMEVPSYLSATEPSIVLPNQQILLLSDARRIISIAFTVPELELSFFEHKLEIYSMAGDGNNIIYHGSYEIAEQYFEVYQAETLAQAEAELTLQAAVYLLCESVELAKKWEEVQEVLRVRSNSGVVVPAVEEQEAVNESTSTASFDDPSDLPLPSTSTTLPTEPEASDHADPLEDGLPASPSLPFNFAIPTTLNELQPLIGSLLSPPLSHLLQSIFPSTASGDATTESSFRADGGNVGEERINLMQVVSGVAKGLTEVLNNVRREADVMREEFERGAGIDTSDVTDTIIQEVKEEKEEKEEQKVKVEKEAAEGDDEQVKVENEDSEENNASIAPQTSTETVLSQEVSDEAAIVQALVTEVEGPQIISDPEVVPPPATVRLSSKSLRDLALEGKRERKAGRDERRRAKALRLENRLQKKLSVKEGKAADIESLVASVVPLAQSASEDVQIATYPASTFAPLSVDSQDLPEALPSSLAQSLPQASPAPQRVPEPIQVLPPRVLSRPSPVPEPIQVLPEAPRTITPTSSSKPAVPSRPIPPRLPRVIVPTPATPRLPTLLHSLSMPGSYHAGRHLSSAHASRDYPAPTRIATIDPVIQVSSPRPVHYTELAEALRGMGVNLMETSVQVAMMDALKVHRLEGLEKVIDETLRKIWS